MLSHRSRFLAAAATVVLVASVYSVRAAEFAGSVQGVVKNASGQALAGAYVKLTNPERRLTFMLVTQAEGRYTMNNLPPGDYTLAFVHEKLGEQEQKVTLAAKDTKTVDQTFKTQ